MQIKIIIIAVIVAILADYLVGTFRALYYLRMGDEAHKEQWWSSRKMWEGIMHKFCEILLLLVAYGVDFIAPYFALDLPFEFVNMVAVFLVVMELGSVLENLRELNPALAKPIDTIKGATGGDKHE